MRPTFQIPRGNRLVYLYGGGVINRDDATRDAHNSYAKCASLSSVFARETEWETHTQGLPDLPSRPLEILHISAVFHTVNPRIKYD